MRQNVSPSAGLFGELRGRAAHAQRRRFLVTRYDT